MKKPTIIKLCPDKICSIHDEKDKEHMFLTVLFKLVSKSNLKFHQNNLLNDQKTGQKINRFMDDLFCCTMLTSQIYMNVLADIGKCSNCNWQLGLQVVSCKNQNKQICCYNSSHRIDRQICCYNSSHTHIIQTRDKVKPGEKLSNRIFLLQEVYKETAYSKVFKENVNNSEFTSQENINKKPCSSGRSLHFIQQWQPLLCSSFDCFRQIQMELIRLKNKCLEIMEDFLLRANLKDDIGTRQQKHFILDKHRDSHTKFKNHKLAIISENNNENSGNNIHENHGDNIHENSGDNILENSRNNIHENSGVNIHENSWDNIYENKLLGLTNVGDQLKKSFVDDKVPMLPTLKEHGDGIKIKAHEDKINNFYQNPSEFVPSHQERDIIVHMLAVHGIPWSYYERETLRVASFARYPATAAKSADLLASSGFVYIGDGVNDRVKCFYCLLEKESWTDIDDIDEFHKSQSPLCPVMVVHSMNNVSTGNSLDATHNFSSAVLYSNNAQNSGQQISNNQAPTERFANQSTAQVVSSESNSPVYDERDSPDTLANLIPSGVQEPVRGLSASNSTTLTTNVTHTSNHPNINSQIYAIPNGTRNNTETNADRPSNRNTEATTNQAGLTYQTLGIFNDRPKYLQFAVIARRLQSFEAWPESHPIKKENLAKSGLYFAGYGDCCRCFFCGGGLRNWEKEDDPIVEHARWFSKCGFLRQLVGDDFVKAVQALAETNSTISLAQVMEFMRQNGQRVNIRSSERTVTDDAAVRSVLHSGHSLDSVTRAANKIKERGEVLSADLILREMRNVSLGATSEVTEADNSPNKERLQALKNQNYALRNNLICKVCMDKEVRIVFLPCGHLVSCQECAVALENCPVCRSHIRATALATMADN